MGATTVILGAGFGGIVCANQLRRLLPPEHRIVLIDKGSTFSFGAAKTWVAIGGKKVSEIQSPLEPLKRRGIDLVQAEILSLDPKSRSVETSSGSFTGDHLVVALGADMDMGAIPGLKESAHSFYTLDGAVRLSKVLPDFKAGKLLVLVPRIPFKCPPGPYEGAMLLHDYLTHRGLRKNVQLSIATTEPRPMGTAGPAVGDFVMAELRARDIAYLTQKKTVSVDPASKVVNFEDGSSAAFDLLIAVDPHVAPKVVVESGLAKPGAWIPADPKTLSVAGIDGVWAIGDVASVPLPGRFKPDIPLVLPKAGVMADSQGRVVAHHIAAKVLGKPTDEVFNGKGFCFLETGDMHAVKGDGDFFRMPNPTMQTRVPDMTQYEDKKRWMSDWIKENLS
jgi:sulfide:quinone oxidoreductase